MGSWLPAMNSRPRRRAACWPSAWVRGWRRFQHAADSASNSILLPRLSATTTRVRVAVRIALDDARHRFDHRVADRIVAGAFVDHGVGQAIVQQPVLDVAVQRARACGLHSPCRRAQSVGRAGVVVVELALERRRQRRPDQRVEAHRAAGRSAGVRSTSWMPSPAAAGCRRHIGRRRCRRCWSMPCVRPRRRRGCTCRAPGSRRPGAPPVCATRLAMPGKGALSRTTTAGR